MARLLFALALMAFASGIVLRILPPALPEGSTHSVTGLPDTPETTGHLRAVTLADEAGMTAPMGMPDITDPTSMPRLVGVTTGREALAHFEYAGGLVTVAAEERIGPWQVQAIHAEGVTVEGPQGMIRLRVYPAETGMEGED
ncbi:MAG: hypothetical protein ACXIVO_02210 [Glycocaulis sp.]